MVGKTRIAATVIKNTYDEQAWLIPGTKEALAALGIATPPVRDSMIFLDDIERLLAVGGITQAEFIGLAKRNAIVGTIRNISTMLTFPLIGFGCWSGIFSAYLVGSSLTCSRHSRGGAVARRSA